MSDAGGGDGTPATRLLEGRLILRQPATGHRVGTDAILLAAAVGAQTGDTVVDGGCGVGCVGLAVALREPSTNIRLIEIAPDLAALARDNAARNGMGDRVEVETADLLAGDLRPAHADWVVSNPPFRLAGEARPSPDADRDRAHRLGPGIGHGAWLLALLRHARPGGALVLIQRPEAVPALLQAAEGRLGGIRLLPVHPRDGAPAVRVLFGGVVGGRSPFALLAPLVLHGADGCFLPLAARLHAGEATLALVETRKSRPRRPALDRQACALPSADPDEVRAVIAIDPADASGIAAVAVTAIAIPVVACTVVAVAVAAVPAVKRAKPETEP